MSAECGIDQRTTRKYLDKLNASAPSSTYRSHKSTLNQFEDYRSNHDISKCDEQSITQFLVHRTNVGSETVRGQIDTLSNFLAIRDQEHPGHVKQNLIQTIRDRTDAESSFSPKCIRLPMPPVGEEKLATVDLLLEAFRTFWRGSQIHLFLEILIDSGNEIEPLLRMNFSDVDHARGEASIPLASNFAVRKHGLQTHWTSEISSKTATLIKSYQESKYKDSSPQPPLFTSSHGRLSKTSLYRDYRDARQKAITTLDVTHSDQLQKLRGSKRALELVSLDDVRRASQGCGPDV